MNSQAQLPVVGEDAAEDEGGHDGSDDGSNSPDQAMADGAADGENAVQALEDDEAAGKSVAQALENSNSGSEGTDVASDSIVTTEGALAARVQERRGHRGHRGRSGVKFCVYLCSRTERSREEPSTRAHSACHGECAGMLGSSQLAAVLEKRYTQDCAHGKDSFRRM